MPGKREHGASKKAASTPLHTSDGSLDPQVILKATEQGEKGKTRRFVAGCISAPICIAATGIPAYFLAGTTTNISVTFALTYGASATVAGGSGWVFGAWKHKKASDARNRVKELENKALAAQHRVTELEADVTRYRADLERKE